MLLVLGEMDDGLWHTGNVSLFAHLGANGNAEILLSPTGGSTATILQVACARGKEELVAELLHSFTFRNDQVEAGLQPALESGSIAVVELLVLRLGKTAGNLEFAIQHGLASTIGALLDGFHDERDLDTLYRALLLATNHGMLTVLLAHKAYNDSMALTVVSASHDEIRKHFDQKWKKDILLGWLAQYNLDGSVKSWLL